MILVSATWMGLYLAKRITRPIQMLAAAAREIGAGHLDHRLEPETFDEFGSLVEAFNRWPASCRRAARSSNGRRSDLQRQHQEVEARRRYIETILERIATGVVSLDAEGRSRRSTARPRGCSASTRGAGQPVGELLARPDLEPLRRVLEGTRGGGQDPPAQEIALARDGRELHLAAATTTLLRRGRRGRGHGARLRRHHAAHPRAEGRGVARGGAAAGARDQEPADADPAVRRAAARHFQSAPRGDARARRGVHRRRSSARSSRSRGSSTSSRSSRGCRRPARSRRDLPHLLADTLALYVGLFREVRIETVLRRRRCRWSASTPSRSGAWSSTWWTTRSRRWTARATSSWRRQFVARRPAWRASSSRTTGRASRRASARSCSCRTIRPSGAAAASASPSSGASSPSTAGRSR